MIEKLKCPDCGVTVEIIPYIIKNSGYYIGCTNLKCKNVDEITGLTIHETIKNWRIYLENRSD